MPVYRLPADHRFPHPSLAEPEGLLAVGGDLSPGRLLTAYSVGIFPWYSEGQPILWFSPDPRAVLRPEALRIARSLKKRVRRGDYEITLDRSFSRVVERCKTTPRPGQDGTWITPEMAQAYRTLHHLGYAHSVEAWRDGQLVGGLYGVGLGRMFAGESMFAHASDASKVAFVWLVRQLAEWGFSFVDCQMQTSHLQRFGAQDIDREAFLDDLSAAIIGGPAPGPWQFDDGFHPLAQGSMATRSE